MAPSEEEQRAARVAELAAKKRKDAEERDAVRRRVAEDKAR